MEKAVIGRRIILENFNVSSTLDDLVKINVGAFMSFTCFVLKY